MIAIFASGFSFADEAYLIIDAFKEPLDSSQPTWIGLVMGRKTIHIPVGEVVSPVKAGRYRISHFDFGKNKYSGMGTIELPRRHQPKFEVSAGVITYIGAVSVSNDGRGIFQKNYKKKYKMGISPTRKLLEWACDKRPELFLHLPVRFMQQDGGFKEVKVRCET